jgi:hypothetical protein
VAAAAGGAGDEHGDDVAVGVDQAGLVGGGGAGAALGPGLGQGGVVFGQGHVAGGLAEQGGGRVADHAGVGRVDGFKAAVGAGDGEALAHGLHDLLGEIALGGGLGLGAGPAGQVALALDIGREERGQHGEHLDLGGAHRARLGIDGAEGAVEGAVVQPDGHADVAAHERDGERQGQVGGARVGAGVGDGEGFGVGCGGDEATDHVGQRQQAARHDGAAARQDSGGHDFGGAAGGVDARAKGGAQVQIGCD